MKINDLKKFDEVTINGRDGFVIVPRYQAHLGVDGRFVDFGCVVIKFFGDKTHYIVEFEDVVLKA